MQSAILFRKVPVPEAFVTLDAEGRRYGGDIRIGDLSGEHGTVDFLVYKSLGGIKPAFLGAFDMDGNALWSVGDARLTAADLDGDNELLHTTSPDRPGPVAIADIDGDGACEVLCLMVDFDVKGDSKWDLRHTRLTLLDGRTGEIKRQNAPDELTCRNAYVDGQRQVANYVHQRFMIADLAGRGAARDFVLKVGDTILAFGPDLELLWTYTSPWNHYPRHSAYIPTIGDLDGDGRDEVIGGHFGLDADGRVLWEKYLGDNMDSVVAASWCNDSSPDSLQAVLSAGGQVLDGRGNTVLELGMEAVPHGQEIRCGCVDVDAPSPQLVIRYDGHHTRLMVVDNGGRIISRFEVDESPNNTGLEIVDWTGEGEADLIFSPSALFDAGGRKVVTLPDLPPPTGGKMGWYHCFVADVCGDERDEVILYDPYSDAVYVYTARPLDQAAFSVYTHTSRQYNARLID